MANNLPLLLLLRRCARLGFRPYEWARYIKSNVAITTRNLSSLPVVKEVNPFESYLLLCNVKLGDCLLDFVNSDLSTAVDV